MKNETFKNVGGATLLLVALGNAGFASAASWLKTGTLGVAAEATDLYQVNCFDNGKGQPTKLGTRILDRAPVSLPVVSVIAFKGALATNSTDTIDGDTAYSSLVYTYGGVGTYKVTVYKTAAGAENYTLYFRCLTSSGVDTGTSLSILQNQ